MDQHLERAQILLQQGRINDAIIQVKQSLQQNPDNDVALAMYARCLFDKKQFDEGITLTRRALALDANNHYYFYLLAFGYYRLNENTKAIQYLLQSIQLHPFFAEAYGLLAHVYCDDNNFLTALQKANEGLAIDPDSISCLNARSVALNKLKRTNEAIETMQLTLAKDPDNEFTHATVGWNYLEKGNNTTAATHFRETLRINPNSANARRGLKEALKSTIPPYRWLLQYSFWINNKGKKARWIFPLALYGIVQILSALLDSNKTTQVLGTALVALYVGFVLFTWLINPLANCFLLFYKDGRYAVDLTEKWSAITVVGTLVTGAVLLFFGVTEHQDKLSAELMIAAFAFLAMSIPLGNIQYPVSFKKYAAKNKLALILIGLGLIAAAMAFIYLPVAILAGVIFMVILLLNNWIRAKPIRF